MLATEQMRYGALILAAIFGGPGIFYDYISFFHPRYAVTALLYLVVATVLALCAEDRSAPKGPGPGRLIRRAIRLHIRRRH